MSLKDEIIKLRKEGKTYLQIQTTLGCSKGTISFHIGDGVKLKQLKRQLKNRTQSVRDLKILHGGKCSICSYSKCLKALDFHHIDPTTKSYVVSDSSLSFSQMAEEAQKCQLVCANCHRELHDNQ